MVVDVEVEPVDVVELVDIDDVLGLSACAALIPPARRNSPKAVQTIFGRTRMIHLPLVLVLRAAWSVPDWDRAEPVIGLISGTL